jgi:hypothetical protein
MLHFFPQFAYGPVLVALAVFGACGTLAWLLVFKVRFFDELAQHPVQAAFAGVPGAFLALILAFMGSAAWRNAELAAESLQQERMAIERLEMLTAGVDGLDDVRRQVDAYVSVVQSEEWGTNFNEQPSARVDTIILGLTRFALRGESGLWSGSRAVETGEFLGSVDRLAMARAKRLELGRLAAFGYIQRWVIVGLLSLVVSVTVLTIHRDRRRAALVSLVCFCLSGTLAMSMVSLHLHPYRGPRAMPATALTEQALTQTHKRGQVFHFSGPHLPV